MRLDICYISQLSGTINKWAYDEDITRSDTPADPPTTLQGPITRALPYMIFRIDCYLMIVLWLGTMERSLTHLRKSLKAWWTSKGVPVKLEAQSNSSSSLPRPPGPVSAKMDAHVAYGLGFGCSIYARKAKKIKFPMELVSCQNKSWVIRNHRRKLMSRTFLSAAPPSFGPLGRVSLLSPLGVRLEDLHASISLYSVAATLVRVWVFLRFILLRTIFTVNRFVRPQLEINLSSSESLQFSCVLSSSCLCSSLHLQGLAFLARSTGLWHHW